MKKLIFSFAAFSAILAGCQVNDLDENNTQQDGETFYINATIPSTKTILTPGEGLYNVEWEENEELSVVATYTDGSQSKGYKFTKGEGNTFSGQVTSPESIGGIYVIYPYSDTHDSYNDTYNNINGFITVGSEADAEQIQAGINSTAHIKGNLCGYAAVSDGTASVTMQHAATLFEVILSNKTGEDLPVSKISITNSENDPMTGSFYIAPQSGSLTPSSSKYISSTAALNVSGDNTTVANEGTAKFYIVSAPFDLAVDATLTITVTMTDGKTATVVKTIPAVEKGKFEAGKVNHINVEIAETEASIEPGEYLIGAYTSSGWAIMTATNQKSEYFDAEKVSSVTKPIESILASDFYMIPAIDQYVWTVEAGEGGFSIKNSNGYLSQRTTTDSKGDKTGYISYSEESTLLSISKENDGTFTIKGQGNAGELPLRYNSSATRFKPYSSQTAIVLIPWIEDTTPRIFATETSKTVNYDETNVTFEYSTRNIDGEISAEKTSDKDNIISSISVNSGTISITLEPNSEEKEKTATLTLSFTGAEDVELNITQNAAPGASTKYYVKVTEEPADWSGQYLIVYEDQSLAFDGSLTGGDSAIDKQGNYTTIDIQDNQIMSTSAIDEISVTINAISGGYSIMTHSGYYIYNKTNKNGMDVSTTETGINSISLNSDGSCLIECNNTKLLFFNQKGSERFRYYTSNQQAIHLYKLQ